MIRTIQWIIFASALASSQAFAAKITILNAEKKQVTLDEGTDTKFVKKAKICFYDANGAKVGCSFIRGAKPKISVIVVKGDKLFAKLVVGMEARLEAAPATTAALGISGEAPTHEEAKKKRKSYITPQLILPLLGPIGYQNLIYETPVGKQVNSMWSSDSAVKNIGAGLELGLGVGSYQLALGLRTRFFIPKKISSDYADNNNDKTYEQYVDTSAKGSSFGAWFDFYWLIVDSGVVNFRLGSGLEFDTSSATFEAVQKSDDNSDENVIYSAKSSLQAISLRILPTLDFIFGPLDFTLGGIIYVPVSQSAKLTIGTVNDPFTTSSLNPDITPEQDLAAALKHKAKPGLDLLLSTGIVF